MEDAVEAAPRRSALPGDPAPALRVEPALGLGPGLRIDDRRVEPIEDLPALADLADIERIPQEMIERPAREGRAACDLAMAIHPAPAHDAQFIEPPAQRPHRAEPEILR